MRERVEALVGNRSRAMWVMTFHSACVRILRREAKRLGLPQRVLDLRPGRLPAADGAGLPRARPRPQALPAARLLRPGLQPQERADRLRDLHGPGVDPPGEDARRGVRDLPGAAPAGRRAGLRRPDHDDGQPPAGVPRRRRALPAAVPARARRRVPGHQPRAVRPGPRAGRPAGRRRGAGARRAVRGRRRRPVDLRLPRRDDPQHPGVRARLPGRERHPAGAELPLDADDPVGGQRGDRAQRRPQAQAAVVRPGRRAQVTGYVADNEHDEAAFVAQEIDRLHDDEDDQARSTSRSSTAPTRSRVCSKRSSSASACRTRSSAACASTSARRSATCSPTCGSSPTPRTP